jgi:hypothetical protein
MSKQTEQTCGHCGAKARHLYQHPDSQKWVGFECLPATFIARYPGWAEREALSERRAEQARLNFT